jgi:putative addiction module component (TIGR02574 family)
MFAHRITEPRLVPQRLHARSKVRYEVNVLTLEQNQMAVTLESLGINRLSVPERLRLVQEIWDSIALESENDALTAEQCAVIDERLAAHERDPDAAIPWEQVRDEARERLKR